VSAAASSLAGQAPERCPGGRARTAMQATVTQRSPAGERRSHECSHQSAPPCPSMAQVGRAWGSVSARKRHATGPGRRCSAGGGQPVVDRRLPFQRSRASSTHAGRPRSHESTRAIYRPRSITGQFMYARRAESVATEDVQIVAAMWTGVPATPELVMLSECTAGEVRRNSNPNIMPRPIAMSGSR
jgi:hypothetical protein